MNWPMVPLGDLGHWFGGGTPSKARSDFWQDGTVPWLSPKDMGHDVLSGTQDLITQAAVEGSAVRKVPAGSVAVVVRSGILERTVPIAVVPFETTLNQDMKALSPHKGVESSWVAWALRSREQRILSDTRKAGTTVASIEFSRLLRLQIPLPDVDEQRRIVAILEEHLSDLDAAAAGLTRVERHSATMIDSVLRKAFSGVLFDDDLSEGSGADLVLRITGRETSSDGHPGYPNWVTARLGDLFEVNVGATPPRGNPELWAGDLPWVSSGEVAFNRIKTTKETIHRAAAGSPTSRIHPAGTVLLAMIGEGKTRGQAAILDIEAAHNQNCASIRVGRTPILPEYLYYFLKRRYAETRSAASGGNQPALNKARVEAIEMPVAPLATQRRLVAAFDSVTSASGRLVAATDRSRRRGESVRRALLAAAFSGRLTGHSSDTNVIEELAEEESA